jgi:hypothetical protein
LSAPENKNPLEKPKKNQQDPSEKPSGKRFQAKAFEQGIKQAISSCIVGWAVCWCSAVGSWIDRGPTYW